MKKIIRGVMWFLLGSALLLGVLYVGYKVTEPKTYQECMAQYMPGATGADDAVEIRRSCYVLHYDTAPAEAAR